MRRTSLVGISGLDLDRSLVVISAGKVCQSVISDDASDDDDDDDDVYYYNC